MKLREGMKLKCIDDHGFEWWSEGEIYEIYSYDGYLEIKSDDGDTYNAEYVNGYYGSHAEFEEVKEMFGKKDLENTMILVGAKGEKLIVMADKVVGRNDWFPLKDIHEDISEYPYEIREVYELSDPMNLASISEFLRTDEIPCGYKMVWRFEEKSPAELKLEEAEQRLAEAQKAVEEARNEIAK